MLPLLRPSCRYCLWRLVHDGRKKVRYEYPMGQGGDDLPMSFGTGTTDICISDGCEPGVAGVMRLLISSPRGSGPAKSSRPVYDNFQHGAARLYMPAPSEAEIMLMAKYCFGHLPAAATSEDAVRNRIKRWGPVPRYVLAGVGTEEHDLTVAIGLQKVDALRRLVQSMSDVVAVDDVSFRVVHYKIDPTFTRVTYVWASEEIGRSVVQTLQRQLRADRFELLADMLANKHTLDLSSPLWETWCDMQMRAGGSLRIRRLGVGSTSGVGKGNAPKPPANSAQLFIDADALLGVNINDASGIGELVVPHAATTVQLAEGGASQLPDASVFAGRRFRAKACFAAADFIEVSGTCSNATVDSKHDLVLVGKDAANGLLPILKRVQPAATWTATSGTPVPFLWLVPPMIFEEIRAGLMKIEPQAELKANALAAEIQAHADATALRAAARQLAPWVVQYAVEVLPPATQQADGASLP